MADERDDDIDREYRRLPREEPPAHLDAAIRAEARRALEAHPAPLVPPTGRRSWAFPMAAAAIIVLAVAVTMQVEREQGDPVVATNELQSKVQEKPAEEPKPKERQAAPARKDAPRAKENKGFVPEPPAIGGKRDEAKVEQQAADSLAKQAGPASSAAPAAPPAVAERRAQTLGAAAVESPERWLERIAGLRREGKHDEADRQLAEFRKRYPDFRIEPAMLERVERR